MVEEGLVRIDTGVDLDVLDEFDTHARFLSSPDDG
jgi:hypothetical protein